MNSKLFKGRNLGYQTISTAVIHAKKKRFTKTLKFFKDLHRNSNSLVSFVTFEPISLNIGEIN